MWHVLASSLRQGRRPHVAARSGSFRSPVLKIREIGGGRGKLTPRPGQCRKCSIGEVGKPSYGMNCVCGLPGSHRPRAEPLKWFESGRSAMRPYATLDQTPAEAEPQQRSLLGRLMPRSGSRTPSMG